MDKPDHFHMEAGHAVFRPRGVMSLEEAVQLVTTAIAFSRQQSVRRLLVDTTGLAGFRPPDLAARYFFIHEWARAAGGGVCVALVARPEMIDPQRFGVTVAANAGFVSDIFPSEQAALGWLQAQGAA